MGEATLVKGAIATGAEVIRALSRIYPVRAAFWLKEEGSRQRYLYVASEIADRGEVIAGYREFGRLAREAESEDFDPWSIKLIPTTHPFARAAVKYQRDWPDQMPARLWDRPFGDGFVDDVYIYPIPLPEPVEEAGAAGGVGGSETPAESPV